MQECKYYLKANICSLGHPMVGEYGKEIFLTREDVQEELRQKRRNDKIT